MQSCDQAEQQVAMVVIRVVGEWPEPKTGLVRPKQLVAIGRAHLLAKQIVRGYSKGNENMEIPTLEYRDGRQHMGDNKLGFVVNRRGARSFWFRR